MFEKNFKEKVKYLTQNKDRKMNHTAIFPSLLHAANITILNDNLDRSILKPYLDYPRKVMGINFETAKIVGACDEIQDTNENPIQ